MAHTVYGYPDVQASARMIEAFDTAGVEYIEVQIPFSDPIADGPTLAHANSEAAAHVSQRDVLQFLRRTAGQRQRSQVVLMCYFQSILSCGIERFCREASDAQVHGLIVPDLPFDQTGYGDLVSATATRGLIIIPVLSPGMNRARLKRYLTPATEMIYLTTRAGVTGAHTTKQQLTDVKETIGIIRRLSPGCAIALGFGIQTERDIINLPAECDTVVVGSAIASRLRNDGLDVAARFVKQLLDACHSAGSQIE